MRDDINMCESSRPVINPQAAQFMIDRKKADEWLELCRQLEYYKNYNDELQKNLRDVENKLHEKIKILDKYIETFWKYELKNIRPDDRIIMPETESYKFYKKVFNEEDYPYSTVKSGNKINLSIEILEGWYKILSREIISTKKKKKDEQWGNK